jgi:hypothetical protein
MLKLERFGLARLPLRYVLAKRPMLRHLFMLHNTHILNMELDLQSSSGLHVHSCTHWLRPRISLPPPHLGSYTWALLVSQDRRHHFVTSWHRLNMEVDFQSLFWAPCHVMSTAVLIGWDPATLSLPPRIWAHIRGRYWSAKTVDISLWPCYISIGPGSRPLYWKNCTVRVYSCSS